MLVCIVGVQSEGMYGRRAMYCNAKACIVGVQSEGMLVCKIKACRLARYIRWFYIRWFMSARGAVVCVVCTDPSIYTFMVTGVSP